MAASKSLLDNFNISFILVLTSVVFSHSAYDFLLLGITSDFQMHHEYWDIIDYGYYLIHFFLTGNPPVKL